MEPMAISRYASSLRIENLQELKGLRLAVSPPAPGTRVLSEQILALYGVDARSQLQGVDDRGIG